MKRTMLALFCAGLLSGMMSLSANAANNPAAQSTVTRQATVQRSPAADATSPAANQAGQTGKAAGIDTAMAASAGGITATVLAVGVAALVVGVAVSDTGGGDDPAPPVTAQAE